VFEPEDIRKVMAVSRATSGPAKDWREQMVRKGPLRRLYKFLPRNDRMDRVLEADDDNYDLDALPVEPPAAKSLKVGFSSPAIEHAPADPAEIPMDMVRDEEMAPADYEQVDEPEQRAPVEPQRDVGQPRLREYADRVAAAQSWLNIKQALRGLMKAEDWDRAEEGRALSMAWARFTDLGDKTDFVLDSLLFACWLEGKDPSPDEIAGNLRVLQTQADWTRAGDEIQAWILKRAADRGTK
jgi:hypothetical protein